MLLSDPVKRLGIFFFFDADGVVDDYVENLLSDMVTNLSELVIVVNGFLAPKNYAKLSAFSSNIMIRENRGLDAWAYKTAMDSYGWDRLIEFDEVVLFNATIMGPVYPFSEMFTEMNNRDLDFWGITWYHKYLDDPFGTTPEGYIPRHIQSHFHVYRRSLMQSEQFQKYWDELPDIADYVDSVGKHEIPFTKRFEDLGFKSGVYVDTNDLEGFTYQPILISPKKIIEEKRCPIFKRRSFFHSYEDILNQSVGTSSLELYEYLRDCTDFDTNLIWNNLLRTINLADLVKNLQLTYVFSSDLSRYQPDPKRVALVFHLYYLDLLAESLQYVQAMPPGCDVYITVGSAEKAEVVTAVCQDLPYNITVRVVENRGRDVSALLVGVKDVVFQYDYICFAHDKKVTQLTPYSKGDGFAQKCFANLFPSRDFVSNVLEKFEQEPRLGMVFPQAPNHAEYFPIYSAAWSNNFANTENLLRSMNIEVPLDPKKEPIAPLGTMFWFRPEALRALFALDWKWEDFPPEPNDIDGTLLHAIERAYGYVAQGSGYFSAYIFSDKFARVELTNLSFYLRELTDAAFNLVPGGTEVEMVHAMRHGLTRRQRIKEMLKVVFPKSLHPILAKYYRRLRKIL